MSDEPPAFFRALAGAFRYPALGDGPLIILAGSVLFSVASAASMFAGLAGIILQIIIGGFIVVWARDVVKTTATGEDKPPGWTDFTDWQESLVEPLLETMLVVAVTFGPFIFLLWKSPANEPVNELAHAAATIWGWLTFPIAFLAVAMTDSVLAALNPVPLARAVWVTLKDYLLLMLWGFVVMALATGMALLIETVAGKIPILPDFIEQALSLYLIAVWMRGIGLYYRRNHETLEWY